jgi:YVTN family beta-propeller protein
LALKPDGGEIFVCNYDGSSISVIETGANEVGQTFLIGSNPVRAVVSDDNSTLYVSNLTSDSLSIYAVDIGRVIGTLPTGSHPDSLALTSNQKYLAVANTMSGDVAILRVQRTTSTSSKSKDREIVTMIRVGEQPNAIVVKAFTTK